MFRPRQFRRPHRPESFRAPSDSPVSGSFDPSSVGPPPAKSAKITGEASPPSLPPSVKPCPSIANTPFQTTHRKIRRLPPQTLLCTYPCECGSHPYSLLPYTKHRTALCCAHSSLLAVQALAKPDAEIHAPTARLLVSLTQADAIDSRNSRADVLPPRQGLPCLLSLAPPPLLLSSRSTHEAPPLALPAMQGTRADSRHGASRVSPLESRTPHRGQALDTSAPVSP